MDEHERWMLLMEALRSRERRAELLAWAWLAVFAVVVGLFAWFVTTVVGCLQALTQGILGEP